MITSVEWREGAVRFLDQSRLPFEEVYVETSDHHRVAEAIRALEIRGAPAIGIAAAYAAVLGVRASVPQSLEEAAKALQVASALLSATRPTAVNLFAALDRLKRRAATCPETSVRGFEECLLAEACAIHDEDREACRRIGEFGAALLPPHAVLLTHCNTGALATGGEGTALNVIRKAAAGAGVREVYVGETRPLLQGSRLTMWELQRDGIPATLITDGTAASILRDRGVMAVIVGADRIVANGDTANKIGTYSLAVLARHHGVRFYVAAPVSTIDLETPEGRSIPIEERPSTEVTHVGRHAITVPGAKVCAPAFDVTPASLIDAIITDGGVATAPYGPALRAFVDRSHPGRGVSR